MKKITNLALGVLASLSLLHSAAFDETSASASASASVSAMPLQKFFDENLRESIDIDRGTPELYQGHYFPEGYRRLGVGMVTIHEQGHLWPVSFRQAIFKHGLLNEFIDRCSGCLKMTYGQETDNLKKQAFFGVFFAKRNSDSVIMENRFAMACSLWTAFQQGLQENQQLLLIGANYLKQKVREEVIKRQGGSFDSSQEAQEKGRADLLQDLAYTIVKRASDIMFLIRNAIRLDKEFQKMIVEKETFEFRYEDSLTDKAFMDECGEPYNRCLVRFNEYISSTRDFFRNYIPTVNGVDREQFGTLELIDLGQEHTRAVPGNLIAALQGDVPSESL